MQYKCPSSAATPQLLLLEDIDGTGDQVPTLGSNLKKKRILDHYLCAVVLIIYHSVLVCY